MKKGPKSRKKQGFSTTPKNSQKTGFCQATHWDPKNREKCIKFKNQQNNNQYKKIINKS